MLKFNTYRALDTVDKVTPVIAYPIFSKEGGQSANDSINRATEKLYELAGYKTTPQTEAVPIPDELIRQIFESEVGAPLIDIDEIMRDM